MIHNLVRGRWVFSALRGIGAVLLTASSTVVSPACAQTTAKWSGPTFSEFSGVDQGSPECQLNKASIGWERHDFPWSSVEPKRGDRRTDVLKKWGGTVVAFRSHGVRVLPVLDYNAQWSFDRGPRTFEYRGSRWSVQPRSDGRYDFTHYTRQPDENESSRAAAWAHHVRSWFNEPGVLPDGPPAVIPGGVMLPLAEEHTRDWENYVRRVVAFLRRPPYNVEYFQIWNEAYPNSGFWYADMDDYMTRVHLPASRIIHGLGGKVVYGGWPCGGALTEFVALLDSHHAWRSIDVIDMHYFPVRAYDFMRKAAASRDDRSPRIWQTEVGFTTDPTYISNTYPRMLSWALANGWTRPDQYKAFYFAEWSPDDPKAYGYHCSFLTGSTLSPHGKSLETLAALLGDGVLKAQTGIGILPALKSEIDEHLSSREAFRVAYRVVVAVHLSEQDAARLLTVPNGGPGQPMVEMRLPFAISAIKRIERVDIAGQRSDVTASATAVGPAQTQVAVPVRDAPGSDAASWIAKAGVRTFYIALTLN